MRISVVGSLVVAAVHLAVPDALLAQEGTLDDRIRTANDELFHKGNVDLADQIFAPTYTSHTAEGQTQPGPQGVRDFVVAMRAAFPDLSVQVEVLSEVADKVTWLRTHRGTFTADFLGTQATGSEISWRTMIVTRYEDGLIAEEWVVSDFAEGVQRAE